MGLIKVYDAEGIEWTVSCDIETKTIRQGSYSPIASDPEEYFGEHRLILKEIYWLECDPIDSEEYQLIEDNIPDWAYEMVEEYLEEYN